jgi:hypothetical protein
MKSLGKNLGSLAVIAFCSVQGYAANPLEGALYGKKLFGYLGVDSLTKSTDATGKPTPYPTTPYYLTLEFWKKGGKWNLSEKTTTGQKSLLEGTLEYNINQKTGDFRLTLKAKEKHKNDPLSKEREENVLLLKKPGFNIASLGDGLLFVRPDKQKIDQFLKEVNSILADKTIQEKYPERYQGFMVFKAQLENQKTLGHLLRVDEKFFDRLIGIRIDHLYIKG